MSNQNQLRPLNSTWQNVLKVLIAVASAILGALGATAIQVQ